MRHRALSLIIPLLAITSSTHSSSLAADLAAVNDGAVLFSQNCSVCHGSTQDALEIDIADRTGPDIDNALREIDEMRDLQMTEEEIAAIKRFLSSIEG